MDSSRIGSFFLAIALLMGDGVAYSAQGLEGMWQVEDSACQGCDPSKGPEVGAMMRITDSALQNPFGPDCRSALDIHVEAELSSTALRDKYDLPVRWLPKDHATRTSVAERLLVNCEGRRLTVLISIDGGQALLMPIEPSTLLRFLKSSDH